VTAGIVLAGGRSLRMGRDKAAVDWHGVPLLHHVCAVVRRGTGGGPVVVVGAHGEEPRDVPAWASVTCDAVAGVGPMQGLLAGLQALPADVERIFLATADVPLLCSGYVEAVIATLAAEPGLDALIPFVRRYRHPLLAAYRVSAAHRLAERLARGERRAGQIFDGRLRLADGSELLRCAGLARQDPGLLSVDDVDTPERLDEARRRPLPLVTVADASGRRERRAARLGALAALEGISLDRVPVRVEGAGAVSDPLFPLAPGDRVRLG
jgi:molybdenum cofactor guanylyltransferase